MKKTYLTLCCLIVSILFLYGQEFHYRFNQLGFLIDEQKSILILSKEAINESFTILDKETNEVVLNVSPESNKMIYGGFDHLYKLNFSSIRRAGEYRIVSSESKVESPYFTIGNDIYSGTPDKLLEFMRQQRCGYNPFLDIECHQKDGMSMYGPMKDSTFINLNGGWHDAGDQLKYLITGSYATAHMLKSFELFPDVFTDQVDDLGKDGGNKIPDILDEAKWGLDWIDKLHHSPNSLVHQIADDRDHIGYKMPDDDKSDYGWGSNSYRVAYFATGNPQGLNKYQSEATGFANLAGRSAAAMAIAARIWKQELKDEMYSDQCLEKARSLFALGLENEGFQQGNSYGAPYRYGEITWADDMEWGAAELFKTTGDSSYLDYAIYYAKLANSESWMNRDTAAHYVYYPFINIGHFALYPHVDKAFQDTLKSYYQDGISFTFNTAKKRAFEIGIPFIWCSNNLLTSLITQIILYEKMTGDTQYRDFMTLQKDWLFGRNPWGTSMFTGIPENGDFPVDVHTSIYVLTKIPVNGGLVDGPVFGSIYDSLLGIHLTEEDEYEDFQSPLVVYHDDIGDYSTNEPTMDGTAGAIIMMAYLASKNLEK